MPKAYKVNLDEKARERIRKYQREYRRAYNAKHPEKMEKHRLSTYTHFLNRHDRLVIPVPPAPPWNADAEQDIISSALISMGEQFEDRLTDGKVILLDTDKGGGQNG